MLVVLVLTSLAALALLPMWLIGSETVVTSLRIHALDASGAEFWQPIYSPDGLLQNAPDFQIPYRWDEWGIVGDSDLAPTIVPWPPPLPSGSRALDPSSHSVGGGRLNVAAHATTDNVLVVHLRYAREGRSVDKTYEVSVGEPGSRLQPKKVDIGRRIHIARTSSSWLKLRVESVLHLEFR